MADTVPVFDATNDPGITEVIRLQLQEGLDCSCAWDVFYFRSCPQWTEELEQELRTLHKLGRPPTDLSKFGIKQK